MRLSRRKNGGKIVNNVVETMSSITESLRRIADIIGVINSIAFQTNILALNAAVEAARAGNRGVVLPWSLPKSAIWLKCSAQAAKLKDLLVNRYHGSI